MPSEIERKFLVADEGWRAEADAGRRLRQFYLCETSAASVRVRIAADGGAWLTIKDAAARLSRREFEYAVPDADAEALAALRQGAIVEKTRHGVDHAGMTWDVDVYAGENAGLVLAELELADEGAAFERPPWLGQEVTGDPRYYASRLAHAPFSAWRTGRGKAEDL